MNAIELSTVGHTGTNACGDCVRPQSNEAVIIETRSPHFYKWWEQVTVGYRFSPEENSEPGITMTDTEYLIDQLCQTQLDYLHVSLGDYRQGSIRPLNASEHNQGVLLDRVVAAVADRKPLIGVGSVRTLEDAQKVIQGGSDLVAIGRQLLIDPETVEKWHRGELAFDAYDTQNREVLVIPQTLHEIIVAREDWVPLKG